MSKYICKLTKHGFANAGGHGGGSTELMEKFYASSTNACAEAERDHGSKIEWSPMKLGQSKSPRFGDPYWYWYQIDLCKIEDED